MSGIFGVFSRDENKDVINLIQFGLYALQHRGQEAFGILTMDKNRLYELKRRGLLSEAISKDIINDFKGNVGLGMVKYAFGYNTKYEPIMPYVFYSKEGPAFISIDGAIANKDFCISELISKIGSNEEELKKYIDTLEGIFSLCYVDLNKMIVIRDRFGTKPIAIGEKDGIYVASSETCGLDSIRFKFIKDVKAGEIYIVDKKETKSIFLDNVKPKLCLFEMIYIARPDSVIDGESVYKARYNMGELLYKECKTDADVVIGSPDSGLISAKGYANASNIEFVDGILKNRYIQRTFIKPNQEDRQDSVNIKLNAIVENIRGKDVVLVDDSIVRGTTIKKIIKILKDAEVNKIHVRVASPPVINSEKYCIDIPDENLLIGYNKKIEEIKEEIGCDSLYYLSLDGLKKCCGDRGYYDSYFISEGANNEHYL